MKITNINIYGFGKWVKKSWDIDKDNGIHLFFGLNEAGKSTFMAFIFAVLFGFPKRGENQFLPKGNAEYGGSITLETEQYGKVVIERTKGRRVKGTVSVYFPDGSMGGEETLEKILQDLDEKSFQGIFYFDLDGLKISAMNPLELNEFLYDTSMTGGKSITEMEKRLQTEMDILFRPQGHKKPLNMLAKELYEKEQQIRLWEKRLNQYDEHVDSLKQAEQELELKKEELTRLGKREQELTKYELLHKLAMEWQEKRIQLSEEARIDFFPEDGVHRLEQLTERLMQTELQWKEARANQDQVEGKLSGIQLPPNWNELKEDLSECTQQFSFVEKWEDEMKDFKLELDHCFQRKEALQKAWQLERFEGEIDLGKIPFQPFMKRNLQEMKEAWHRVTERKENLLGALERVDQQLRSKDEEISQIEGQRLTEQNRDRYTEILDRHKNNHHEVKKELLLERLMEMERDKKKGEKREKQQLQLFFILTAFLALCSVIAFIFTDGFVPFLFLGITIVSVVISIWKKRQGEQLMKDYALSMNQLKDQTSQLEELLLKDEHVDLLMIEELLHKDRDLASSYDVKLLERKSLQSEKQEMLQRLEKCERELVVIQEALNSWSEDYGLPRVLDFALYESLLEDLEEWQTINEQEQHYQNKYNQLFERYKRYETKVISLYERTSLMKDGMWDESNTDEFLSQLVRRLKLFLQAGIEKEMDKLKLEEKLQHGLEMISRLQLQINELMEKQQKLLDKGNAATEEEFRQKARAFTKQKKLDEEIGQLFVRMKQIFSEEEEVLHEAIHLLLHEGFDPVEEHGKVQIIKRKKEEEIEEILEQISEVKQEIGILEEDGTYEELQLQFIQKQEELQSLAKRWSIFAVAKGIIDEVKRVYEEERQPHVLTEAERIFTQLTTGEYTHLYAPLGEEPFIVERRDGVRFEPYELSRGTCELLYLSLRLALANTFGKNQVFFPLFIDEAFVNMDSYRRKNIVEFLKKMAEERQILIFTCHEHIKNEFQEKVVSL